MFAENRFVFTSLHLKFIPAMIQHFSLVSIISILPWLFCDNTKPFFLFYRWMQQTRYQKIICQNIFQHLSSLNLFNLSWTSLCFASQLLCRVLAVMDETKEMEKYSKYLFFKACQVSHFNSTLGRGCSTAVEHTPAEHLSCGHGFDSRRVLGFFPFFLSFSC